MKNNSATRYKVLLFVMLGCFLVSTQITVGELPYPDQFILNWLHEVPGYEGIPTDGSGFGSRVSIHNGKLAIGSPSQRFLDDDAQLYRYGAAFTLNEGKIDWINYEILTDEGATDDGCVYLNESWQLGDSIVLSGTHLAVGAPFKNVEVVNNICHYKAGAVYVYQDSPNPLSVDWIENGYLESPNVEAGELFGDAVALTTTQLMVGASSLEDGSDPLGTVYIYDLFDLAGLPATTLQNSPAENGKDGFGAAIAVDTSTESLMAIGAPSANKPGTWDCGGGVDEGGVFVYREVAGVWAPETTLWPTSPVNEHGEFGKAVAVGIDQEGVERVVVGEPSRNLNPSGTNCPYVFESGLGRVYIFKRDPNSSTWEVEAIFDSPASLPENDEFGYSVAIDGWDIVVGARREEGSNGDPTVGAGYLISNSSCGWSIMSRLEDGSNPSQWLGSSAAIEDGWIVLGASNTDAFANDGIDESHGAAYGYIYTPIVMEGCSGDFNGNDAVDVSDLMLLLSNWGIYPAIEPIKGDLTCDQVIDVSDVLVLISTWGPCFSTGGSMPSEVQDCFDLYPAGSIELIECLEDMQ